MPKPSENDQDVASQPSRLPLRQRAGQSVRKLRDWSAANRLRAGLVVAACLASLTGVVAAWLIIGSYRPAVQGVTLDQVLESLDLRDYAQTRELAGKLQEQNALAPDELGGPVFALGAAAAYEADEVSGKERLKRFRLAAGYLEEARDLGFAPGRRAEGTYLLGRSLYFSGRIAESRLALLSALKLNKKKSTEIHRLLADAYLNDANPKLDKALEENTAFLADGKLPAAARHQGSLQRAQILLGLGKIAECTAALEEIPSDAKNRADAVILTGRVLMYEAQQLKSKPEITADEQVAVRDKYKAAVSSLQLAQSFDTLATQATGKAMYLIGLCFLETGDYRAALDQFIRTEKLYPDTPEGLAANFQEADLSRQLGREAEALAGYRRALGAVPGSSNFSNPWFTPDQLRSRMLVAYQHYLDAQNFEVALQLTRSFYPLFPKSRALELTAQTHMAWGRKFTAEAKQVRLDEAEPLRLLARAQFRHAGGVYTRLADLQSVTRQYPDQLWLSATAYLDGHDYRSAIKLLHVYLKNESRARHPQALVLLGEAKLALNRPDEALEDFQQCVEFHFRDATAYRARLMASKAWIEKKDMAKAEALLLENLNGEYLTPASQEWRDSLFALGQLLHLQGRYDDAIVRLEEALARYPEDPQALDAKYLIACCCRQNAQAARDKLEQGPAGTTRVVNSRRLQEQFEMALEKFESIRVSLGHRQESTELTAAEKSILRNSYFAIGEIYFDLGQYQQAVDAYSAIANRYQNAPEVLEAYVQIAHAYRRLNRPAEARSALEQAKVVLGYLKKDANFTETTNYTREQWTSRLDWLASL